MTEIFTRVMNLPLDSKLCALLLLIIALLAFEATRAEKHDDDYDYEDHE